MAPDMAWKFDSLTIGCVKGDITQQADMDAIVNAANAQLRTGGGVAGAIHRTAGPGLEEESEALAPISPGQAVITNAYNLPNLYVIHCLGPIYGRDEPAADLLANCYRNALVLADSKELGSVAFPAISTGAFGYPFAKATRVAIRAVRDVAGDLDFVRRVRFVLFSAQNMTTYEQLLDELLVS